ncbi:MAG: MgtC/SapB family protein [Clostridia bacterium]|nr:MgtC/SapB family protein [Clostridia bacterium]MBR3819899.1 MgtC/SapB family protein [Clostridia bacterium]
MQNILDAVYSDFSANGYLLVRMVLAGFCGVVIGFERSRRQKDAGIRTHMIVALGAALAMIVSKYGFFDLLQFEGLRADASRIASNVITGVGFLGAGVIFVKDVSIKGLTTAAGIWTTASVGLAIGAGMYTVALGATLLMVLFQLVFHRFFTRLENTVNEFTVTISDSLNAVKDFRAMLEKNKILVENCKMSRNDDSTITLDITIKKARTTSMDEILLIAEQNEHIISVEI